jgi:ABC-2 type transport system permease protein
MRRAITGVTVLDTPLTRYSHGDIALILLLTTIGLSVIAVIFYRWSIRRAWRNGKIEEVSGM